MMSLPPRSFSLQRTLAIRFSLTMFVGLLALAVWGYHAVSQPINQLIALNGVAGPSLVSIESSLESLRLQLGAIVLLGTLATAIGAGWLAASSVAPVHTITAQARGITGEVAGQRITAHGNVSEFQGLIGVLNGMVARLERASRWHRRIIRDLGHDLRTPIAAMRAAVEVALWKDRSPAEYRRILAGTLEEIDRLTLISDALVLLGRLQAGEVTLRLAELDVGKLAREAVVQMQDGIGAHKVTLVESAGEVSIKADTRLMRMVLDQLLDNARRYTPPGSCIDVLVRTSGSNLSITVEDNGPGVPEDVLPHLFEPFYRSDQARGRDGGPGLGLTATASIVALHGGNVTASRGSEGGLRVTVSIPRWGRRVRGAASVRGSRCAPCRVAADARS
jgi:two-component system heavy metal sensor histidine kinase CusS